MTFAPGNFLRAVVNDGHAGREVQMITKRREPKTIMRYDHARENLADSPINSLSWAGD